MVTAHYLFGGANAGTPEASLAAVLARDGIRLNPSDVMWLSADTSFSRGRAALFPAHRAGELTDLYYAEVRPTSRGGVADVAWVSNLTRTSSAAEVMPLRIGSFVMYASRVGNEYDAFVTLDLRGEPAALTHDWPWRARVQNAVTNVQETGRREGFGRQRYALLAPVSSLHIARDGERFAVTAGGHRVVIDPTRNEPLEGASFVEARPNDKSQPGLITWVVDTVRNVSWIGPKPIEWLEHTVFDVQDKFARLRFAVFGSGDTAAEAAADIGATPVSADAQRRALLTAADPEIGFPPASMTPVLTNDPVRGEGEWIPVVDDPFVQSYPNAPPAFYQTFIRVDPERGFARIYITLWDPRQVQLHIMTGTREPESATGETGPGIVPRDDETLSRMVAGFNGGFQAQHGEFGMMSEGRVYLPPKPWAATVAVYDDGRVAMGSWQGPEDTRLSQFTEEAATRQIPENMIEMRQNLTSVVENGTYNPWSRWWWGAAPEAATEQTFTNRTGLCQTREGFYAFFWGGSMGPEALGTAMNALHCVRGMHLDMNSKHTAFEFYRLARAGAVLPPVTSPLTDGFFEGPLMNAEGASGQWIVRTRKAVFSMDPMRFPRYIRRDPRDFFYLTLKPVLPGPDLDGGVRFTTTGLPHAGWPHAFARASFPSSGAATWAVRIDPARALMGPTSREDARRVLAYLSGARNLARDGASYAVYATHAHLGWRFAVGAPAAGARTLIAGAELESSRDARAALGVDADGFLVYMERAPGDSSSLHARMQAAHVARAIALPDGVRLVFVSDGTDVGIDGESEVEIDHASALAIYAEERPVAEVLNPDVQPMPYSRWGRLQGTRIRYLHEGPSRFVRPPGTM
ncbi:MAG: hypothetical protein IPK60_01400 [Sandaracinaceae bacterium]|nr:hypothetical protein [Sandaracinaceae bacterium]